MSEQSVGANGPLNFKTRKKPNVFAQKKTYRTCFSKKEREKLFGELLGKVFTDRMLATVRN